MIPIKNVENIISNYESLEKELSSSLIDKKNFASKSKEYSNIKDIINEARAYARFETDKQDIEKIINDKTSDKEMVELAKNATRNFFPKFLVLIVFASFKK